MKEYTDRQFSIAPRQLAKYPDVTAHRLEWTGDKRALFLSDGELHGLTTTLTDYQAAGDSE